MFRVMTSIDQPLRILHLEDDSDSELVRAFLTKVGTTILRGLAR
jgi:hypothetical protein